MTTPSRRERFRLDHIEARNFKRFAHLAVSLKRFNLLVGPNNSGKSTVLEACRLFDFCYRSCLRTQDDDSLSLARSVVVTDAELPIAGSIMHQHMIPELDEGAPPYWPPPVVLGARLRAGAQLRSYRFRLELRGAQVVNRRRGDSGPAPPGHFGGEFTLTCEADSDPPVPADAIGVTFVPGFVGLLPREEPRPPRALRDLRAEGQYREIIRNLLLDLQADPERWQLLGELLQGVFPEIALLSPEFNIQADRFIRASYDEQQRDRADRITLDLFAAGSGFHQFVQILTAILIEDAPTVLLDEPDAHVFSRLQGQLYRVLERLVDRGYQIIAATHSPDLIAAAAPAEIVSFANGEPHRLRVREEVAVFAEERLGALENLKLLLVDAYRKIVIVEGPSDERYLRWWIEELLPDAWPLMQRRLVFIPAGGRGDLANHVNIMLDTLENTFAERKEIRAFVLADRDHRMEQELSAEAHRRSGPVYGRQRWHVLSRVEIESYLLDEGALVRAVHARAPQIDSAAIASEFWQAIEASKQGSLDQTADRLSKIERDKKWSTIRRDAESHFQQHWQGEGRLALCDPKPVLRRLLSVCKDAWGVSIKSRDLLREVARRGTPTEMDQLARELLEFLSPGR